MNDDTISRQAAIEAVEKESQIDGAYGYMDTKSIVDLLSDLPSAERRGRWTDHSDEWDGGYYECSVCGGAFAFIEGTPKENNYRYCPNCGARMEVEE